MAKNKYGKTRTVPHRRKREGRTNYKKRLNLLKSRTPRLVVRRSTRTITAQVIKFNPDGDQVLASASSKSIAKLGWKAYGANMSAAYLVGYLLGKSAQAKGCEQAVLDLGLDNSMRGSKLYATLKGALDAGLNVNHSEDVLPSEERVNGTHIAKYAETLKADQEKYNKQFSAYLKQGVQPENLTNLFAEVKKKIA